MKNIDYAPSVLKELANANREVAQTELTELVWGTSGRGNSTLTNSLFPYIIRKGWAMMRTKGRSKLFSITDLGRQLLGTGDEHANWNFETHTFNTIGSI